VTEILFRMHLFSKPWQQAEWQAFLTPHGLTYKDKQPGAGVIAVRVSNDKTTVDAVVAAMQTAYTAELSLITTMASRR